MNESYICTSCGYRGKPKKWTKGSFAIELLLWFFFLIPGLIYTIWRLTSKAEVCPSCKQPTMIPLHTPMGQKLMREFKHNEAETDDYSDNDVEETTFRPNVFESLAFQLAPDNQWNVLKKWWFWVILIFVSFLIIRGSSGDTNNGQTEQPKADIPSASSKNSQVTQYVFDIPSLVGKDLNGVIAVLGTPKGQDPTAQQIALGAKEWDKSFVKDGKKLLVTYTISNRKIIDFFLNADDPSGKIKNTTHLMELGNLKQNDPRYKVEFVKVLKDPSSFTGVKIIPK